MSKKSLIKTNPYLKDPSKRHKMFVTSASSSTAIEGVHKVVTKALEFSKTTVRNVCSTSKASSPKKGKSNTFK